MMTRRASYIDSLIVCEHFGGSLEGRSKYWRFWLQTTLIVIRLLQQADKPGYTPLSNGNTQGSAKVRVHL